MLIMPIKQEYVFSVMTHSMRAVVEHKNDARNLNYYFDSTLVASRVKPGGDFYTDDECICEVIEDYRKNNRGIYADLFNHHTDKIFLESKYLEVDLINNGITIRAKVKIVKDYYDIELVTDRGENQFSGRVKAADFPEVLEKMRLFINTLEGVSVELTQQISLLSNDQIEKAIKWNAEEN